MRFLLACDHVFHYLPEQFINSYSIYVSTETWSKRCKRVCILECTVNRPIPETISNFHVLASAQLPPLPKTTQGPSLSPFTKQGHKSSTESHQNDGRKQCLQRTVAHRFTEHEFMSHQFHQSSIDQNTR